MYILTIIFGIIVIIFNKWVGKGIVDYNKNQSGTKVNLNFIRIFLVIIGLGFCCFGLLKVFKLF